MSYICPECKQPQTKRKDGCCPECWTPVRIFRTKDGDSIWVREGADTPPVELMNYWQEIMSRRLSKDNGIQVPFHIHPYKHKAKYNREVALAERLLVSADWDMEVAKRALSKVVKEAYKAPVTLAWVMDTYLTNVFIVQAEIQNEKLPSMEERTHKAILSGENVWD